MKKMGSVRDPARYGVHVPDPYWYETTTWMDAPTCYTDQLSSDEIKRLVEKCYDEFCSPMFIEQHKDAPGDFAYTQLAR
jgi:hypothetical protein